MELTNAHVATVVRSLAGIKGLSTNALASMADEPTPNFRRYFWTGERPIPFSAVVKVAGVFGMSTSELLRKAEQVAPEPFIEPGARTPAPPDLAPIPDEISAMLSKSGHKVKRQSRPRAQRPTPKGESETG